MPALALAVQTEVAAERGVGGRWLSLCMGRRDPAIVGVGEAALAMRGLGVRERGVVDRNELVEAALPRRSDDPIPTLRRARVPDAKLGARGSTAERHHHLDERSALAFCAQPPLPLAHRDRDDPLAGGRRLDSRRRRGRHHRERRR